MSVGAVELELDGGSEIVPASRAFVLERLPDHAGTADDAALVVTELVTNALLHGRPPVRVRVVPAGDAVRIEVEDASPDLPVQPRRSSEAMTGRGLALVRGLAREWGVEPTDGGKVVWAELAPGTSAEPADDASPVDLDDLLAAFPDEDAEPLHTVELGSVPTDLLLAAKAHLDNVVREFTLEAASADAAAESSGDRVPRELAQLVRTVVHGFAAARTSIKRQAIAAAERGDREVRLELTLPASAATSGEQYLAALDEADRWARGARLLTLETPPVHKVFRQWYVQTLVDQLRAVAAGTPLPPVETFPERLAAALQPASRVDHAALFRQLPTSYMVMDRDLVFVEANDAYLATTGRTREELIGRPVFEAFPPAPDALDEDGVSRIQRSFERARDTGRVDAMPVQKYDIPGPDGTLEERYWSLISVPIVDAHGEVVLVAQRAEDITDFVRERVRGQEQLERTAELGRRVLEVEADLFARAQELEAATVARDAAARRVASLAGVALEISAAEDVEALTRVVFTRGLPVLDADGGAVVVRDDDEGVVRLVISDELSGQVPPHYAVLPVDHPLPGVQVARSGETVLLPTRAAGLAWSDAMQEVYEATQRQAWAVLPLRVGEDLLGSLVASWRDERSFAPEDVALLEGFAAQVSQALLRIQATQAQREAAAEAQRLSETLQRSLLTDPPQVADLHIAVRYQPAAQEAQIGGDWYDAFLTRSGSTLLVIGDIAGHDRTAAARMGQVRNLLRGMAYDSDDGPARLLTRLDTALEGLGLDTLATALLARVEPGGDGGRRLRWSCAGHLPPVLRTPDGRIEVLDVESDLLLGLDAGTPRTEQVVDLAPGTTLVLFTDGLVERRDTSLDVGVARVVDAVRRLGDADPDVTAEVTADAVVTAAGSSNEDDIAVLVLRAG